MVLTEDEQALETRHLGFTISPHEECAVEEAVRLVEANGGETVVLTLGPAEAEEQLRDCMAIGADRGILLKTDGAEWDPQATAAAIVDAIRAEDPFDLIMFGNESADAGNYQVGIRVAYALGLPVVTGLKKIDVDPTICTVAGSSRHMYCTASCSPSFWCSGGRYAITMYLPTDGPDPALVAYERRPCASVSGEPSASVTGSRPSG